MQLELVNKLSFLVGDLETLHELKSKGSISLFSDKVLSFLNELSRSLMTDKEAKLYSDIMTFAFWCRKASVLHMKEDYDNLSERRGRGIVFHIAPSNIPMMFMFSLTASLLAGNANLIRLSSKDFPQTGIVCRHLNRLLEADYPDLKEWIVILRYPHDREITAYFSKICDSRVIWGGDNSVNEIRKCELSPSAIDLPFYDRFSFSIIKVKEYLQSEDKKEIAEKFYNDTYLTDQNACTSPQLVIWYSEETEEVSLAQETFWRELLELVHKKYQFQSIQAIDKLTVAANYAIAYADGKAIWKDMSLVQVKIDQLHSGLKKYRCPGGYFYEYVTSNLKDITLLCTKECQTISYYGISRNEIKSCLEGCKGVDRIVPIGNTMDFGLKWDGFDFIYSLSRIIA